jgi:hypothetical protein
LEVEMEIVSLPVTVDGRDDLKASVKAIRVNGKPLSLRAFRQLPRRKMIDQEEPRLLETPVGWVNYDPGDADAEFTHFVLESASVLYRCPVLVRRSDVYSYRSGQGIMPLTHNKSKEWCQRWDRIMDVLEAVEQVLIAV